MLKKFNTIEEMEVYISSKIHGAFSVMDMYVLSDYVKRLKEGDSYLEIGVDYGKSAATAMFQAKERLNFYFCDIIDRKAPGPQYPQLLSRSDFFLKEGFTEISNWIQMDSKDLARKWWGDRLSMIFIDGDHSYEGIKSDILSWMPFLKSGGYVLFHDYDVTSPGVIKAVDELIKNSAYYKDFFIAVDKFNMRSSIAGAQKI